MPVTGLSGLRRPLSGLAGINANGGNAPTGPELVSATVAANGTTWTLVFDKAVTGSLGFESSFAITLVYASGDGTSTLVFTGSAVLYEDYADSLNYTPGDVEDLAGNPLAEFFGASVTNNSEVFSPESIADYEVGLWPKASQPANLWENTGKTTPANVTTDPVRVATDIFASIDGVAPSDAARGILLNPSAAFWNITFDGSDDFFSFGNMPGVFDSTNQTFSILMRVTPLDIAAGPGSAQYIIGRDQDTGGRYGGIGIRNTGVAFAQFEGPGVGTDANTVMTNGNTYTIEVYNSPAELRIFLNGVSDGNTTQGLGSATTGVPLCIAGRTYVGFVWPFKGRIWGCAIYSRLLSDPEKLTVRNYLATLSP